MQIIAPARSRRRGIPVLSVLSGLVLGTVLLTIACVIAYLTVTTPFLARVSVGSPLTASRVLVGVLAWTFALTAPVGFGLVGFLRVANAVERVVHRERKTPTVRVARSLGNDLHVAATVLLPDGRSVPELVIGPFGAAVLAELPSARSIRRLGTAWEQRMADGKWQSIENPLERTVRDAERVRRWFGADERDFIVKVHAAVVDAALSVERTPMCAVITPAQIPAWLASLPAQRGMSADRRERLVEKVRTAV